MSAQASRALSNRTTLRPKPLQHGIDQHVDPTQEETRDGSYPVEGLAARRQGFQPGEIRVRHLPVTRQPEQERNIDIDPFSRQVLDGRHALAGCRDLNHHIRAIDRTPQVTGFGNRAGCIMCQFGRNLQAHKSIPAIQPVKCGPEEVRGALDIFHGERFVYFFNTFALHGQGADVTIVIVTPRDGFLKDGRIRGQPAGPILVDQLLDFPIGKRMAPEKIEPDTLTKAL